MPKNKGAAAAAAAGTVAAAATTTAEAAIPEVSRMDVDMETKSGGDFRLAEAGQNEKRNTVSYAEEIAAYQKQLPLIDPFDYPLITETYLKLTLAQFLENPKGNDFRESFQFCREFSRKIIPRSLKNCALSLQFSEAALVFFRHRLHDMAACFNAKALLFDIQQDTIHSLRILLRRVEHYCHVDFNDLGHSVRKMVIDLFEQIVKLFSIAPPNKLRFILDDFKKFIFALNGQHTFFINNPGMLLIFKKLAGSFSKDSKEDDIQKFILASFRYLTPAINVGPDLKKIEPKEINELLNYASVLLSNITPSYPFKKEFYRFLKIGIANFIILNQEFLFEHVFSCINVMTRKYAAEDEDSILLTVYLMKVGLSLKRFEQVEATANSLVNLLKKLKIEMASFVLRTIGEELSDLANAFTLNGVPPSLGKWGVRLLQEGLQFPLPDPEKAQIKSCLIRLQLIWDREALGEKSFSEFLALLKVANDKLASRKASYKVGQASDLRRLETMGWNIANHLKKILMNDSTQKFCTEDQLRQLYRCTFLLIDRKDGYDIVLPFLKFMSRAFELPEGLQQAAMNHNLSLLASEFAPRDYFLNDSNDMKIFLDSNAPSKMNQGLVALADTLFEKKWFAEAAKCYDLSHALEMVWVREGGISAEHQRNGFRTRFNKARAFFNNHQYELALSTLFAERFSWVQKTRRMTENETKTRDEIFNSIVVKISKTTHADENSKLRYFNAFGLALTDVLNANISEELKIYGVTKLLAMMLQRVQELHLKYSQNEGSFYHRLCRGFFRVSTSIYEYCREKKPSDLNQSLVDFQLIIRLMEIIKSFLPATQYPLVQINRCQTMLLECIWRIKANAIDAKGLQETLELSMILVKKIDRTHFDKREDFDKFEVELEFLMECLQEAGGYLQCKDYSKQVALIFEMIVDYYNRQPEKPLRYFFSNFELMAAYVKLISDPLITPEESQKILEKMKRLAENLQENLKYLNSEMFYAFHNSALQLYLVWRKSEAEEEIKFKKEKELGKKSSISLAKEMLPIIKQYGAIFFGLATTPACIVIPSTYVWLDKVLEYEGLIWVRENLALFNIRDMVFVSGVIRRALNQNQFDIVKQVAILNSLGNVFNASWLKNFILTTTNIKPNIDAKLLDEKLRKIACNLDLVLNWVVYPGTSLGFFSGLVEKTSVVKSTPRGGILIEETRPNSIGSGNNLTIAAQILQLNDPDLANIPFSILRRFVYDQLSQRMAMRAQPVLRLENVPEGIRNTAKVAQHYYWKQSSSTANAKRDQDNPHAISKTMGLKLYFLLENQFPARILRQLIYQQMSVLAKKNAKVNFFSSSFLPDILSAAKEIENDLKGFFSAIEKNLIERGCGALFCLDKQNFIQTIGGVLICVLERKDFRNISDIMNFIKRSNFLNELYNTFIHFVIVQREIIDQSASASEHKPDEDVKMEVDSKTTEESQRVGLPLHIYAKGKLEVLLFTEKTIHQWVQSIVDTIMKRKAEAEAASSRAQSGSSGAMLMQFAHAPMDISNGNGNNNSSGRRSNSDNGDEGTDDTVKNSGAASLKKARK